MNIGAWLGEGFKGLMRSFLLKDLIQFISTLTKGKSRACTEKFSQLNTRVLNTGNARLTSMLNSLQSVCASFGCASVVSSIIMLVVATVLGYFISAIAGAGSSSLGIAALTGAIGFVALLFSLLFSFGVPFLVSYLLDGFKTKPMAVSTLKIDYFVIVVIALVNLWNRVLSPVASSLSDIVSMIFAEFSFVSFIATLVTLVFSVYIGAVMLNIIARGLNAIEDFILSVSDADLMPENTMMGNGQYDAWGNNVNLNKDNVNLNKDSNAWGGQQTSTDWSNLQSPQTNWEQPQSPTDWSNSNNQNNWGNDNNNNSWN